MPALAMVAVTESLQQHQVTARAPRARVPVLLLARPLGDLHRLVGGRAESLHVGDFDRPQQRHQDVRVPAEHEGREHDESGSGQEEVNVIVRGSGHYRIEGEDVPANVWMFFRFDSETTRAPVGGPDGMTMIAVGARRGSYEPRGPF
jgi:hypothetical protein